MVKPLAWIAAAAMLLLIGRCSAPDTTDQERANWRREARAEVNKKNLVIDSLTELGLEHKQRADSLETVTRSHFVKVEHDTTFIPLPDTSPSDSVRYWKAKAEGYRDAYLGQIQVTISERLRAEAAEAARDSSQSDNRALKILLSQGVAISEASECKVAGFIPCPSRTVTGALLFVSGVVLGVELGK